ncbi:MAG: hypothetical protein UY04_C0010G0022 [Parcubacteria group bacterium GW2011_GWA2_47_7]|nr:MAG: hypothetical protein UY04_C0010G0022 [Parcubacteria group bacterium GW2011_GWA2_47_7]
MALPLFAKQVDADFSAHIADCDSRFKKVPKDRKSNLAKWEQLLAARKVTMVQRAQARGEEYLNALIIAVQALIKGVPLDSKDFILKQVTPSVCRFCYRQRAGYGHPLLHHSPTS